MVDERELAERLLAVGQHRVLGVGAVGEAAGTETAARVRARDDRRQVAVDDLVARAEHGEDRCARLWVAGWVDRGPVEHRLAGRREDQAAEGVALGGEVHVVSGDLAAEEERVLRLHVDRAEQARGRRAAVAVTAGHGRRRVEDVLPLPLGVEGVDRRAARGHQAGRVLAHERSVVGDRVDELKADHVDPGVAGGRLVLVHRGRVQQVLEVDLQAVAHAHAQHQGAGTPVGPEHHVARQQSADAVDWHDVAPQGVDHPLGLDGAEPVPEEDLVERHHVRRDGAVAARPGVPGFCRRARQPQAQTECEDEDHQGRHRGTRAVRRSKCHETSSVAP